MRKKTQFENWLEIYESISATEDRSEIYKRMSQTAKTFSDWDTVHKYAANRSTFEWDSFEKMKKLAIEDGDTVEIVRVMSFLGDTERDEFLSDVMNTHKDSESVAKIVINFLDPGNDGWDTAFYNLNGLYGDPRNDCIEELERVQDQARNDILLKFLETYHEKVDGRFVCRLMDFFQDSKAYQKGWEIAEGDVL